ncbi:MAG TPA: DUF4388 domain-containing protein [Polyangiaceae bacterium]|nr:DUF4388 domain-containing protein [Polyangiaceae bacterium]
MRDPRAELVRIDSHGQAHAIGSVASQRLRAREGTYRLLPTPRHVVFMRYTGEDGQRDASDGAVVRLAGEITAPGALCDVFALLAQTGWRGELAVLDDDHVRSIFFDQGNVVGAVTNVEHERIGSVLYKFGAIDRAQLEQALVAQAGGKRFGEVVLELGWLTREQLYQFMSRQIEEIVFAVLGVSDGMFFFLDGFDDARLVVRHTVGASALLIDSVTRMDEVRFFRQKIPSSEHVPVRSEGSLPPSEFAAVYGAVDGTRSVEEVGRITGLGEFETTKHLYALVQSHCVAIRPPPVTGGPHAIVAAANAALSAIFSAVAADGHVKELASSLASFAVGAGVYDILLRGAGPNSEGELAADVVVENSVLVAAGADPAQVLRQMLHEYVSFALFSVGAVLGSGAEAELARQVTPMLAVLRPVG